MFISKKKITEIIWSCAKGSYQKKILMGYENWSGSSLKGSAKSDWWFKYKESRFNLLRRIQGKLHKHGWDYALRSAVGLILISSNHNVYKWNNGDLVYLWKSQNIRIRAYIPKNRGGGSGKVYEFVSHVVEIGNIFKRIITLFCKYEDVGIDVMCTKDIRSTISSLLPLKYRDRCLVTLVVKGTIT